MHETEFYQQILGLMSPWIVANVNFDLEAGQLTVMLSTPTARSSADPSAIHTKLTPLKKVAKPSAIV